MSRCSANDLNKVREITSQSPTMPSLRHNKPQVLYKGTLSGVKELSTSSACRRGRRCFQRHRTSTDFGNAVCYSWVVTFLEWLNCQLGSKLTLAQMSWSNLRQQLESPWNQQASPSVAQANTFCMFVASLQVSSHGTEEVHVEEEILIVQGLPMFLLGHPAIKWSQIGSDKSNWLFWKRRCSGSVIETCITTAIACSYAYSYICSVVELYHMFYGHPWLKLWKCKAD